MAGRSGGAGVASGRPLVLAGWSLLGTGLLVAVFLVRRWLLPGAWAWGLAALVGGWGASLVLLGLVG